MAQDTVFYQKIEQIFDQRSTPLIMGILNVTPDSFFDGGKYTEEQHWLAHTKEMIEAGADLIDLGAYSTRPGAKNVSETEELQRLIKVIESFELIFNNLLTIDFLEMPAKIGSLKSWNLFKFLSNSKLCSTVFPNPNPGSKITFFTPNLSNSFSFSLKKACTSSTTFLY